MQELQSSKLSQFLAKMKPYFLGAPAVVGGEKVWNLKQTILADGPIALNAIQSEASSLGITFSRFPSPKFSLKEFTEQTDNVLLYLHESQIEDGGPQPRIEINPSDPETQALFELIKANGQRVPINVYPSPNTPGKYRIAEGHRRRMIIFNMLRLDGIWAVSKQRSELEAYEDAFDLNNARKNLSVVDQAKFFVILMQKFPAIYPNQQSIADRRKLSKGYVSEVLSILKMVAAQKENVSEEIVLQANKLAKHTLLSVDTATEETKADILTAVVENKLSHTQTEKLVDAVKANLEPTSEFVAEEAKRIREQKATDRAQELFEEADKTVAKTERARDKVVAAGETCPVPEELMTAVFGHLGLKGNGKVDSEKAKAYASTVVAVLFQRAIDKDELDDVLREADTWR